MAQLKYWNGSAWVNAVVGAQGPSGIQGTTGSGIQGTQGTLGLQGTTGTGTQGTTGLQGFTGTQGTAGTSITLGANVATFLATPSSANLAAALTDETGTGANVFANSPTLITPALGTPSSVNLSNGTSLPISSGVSGLGTGVATFLATPSSANLATAVTGETGSGALVFGTDPTITPAAGTTTTAAAGAGYMGLPQNATTTGAYTIVAADAGKHIYSTATRTVTINSNSNLALPIGTTITFIAATGATVTIAITSDTMWLAGTGTTGSRTLAPFGMATAVKVASTTWIISGNGLT